MTVNLNCVTGPVMMKGKLRRRGPSQGTPKSIGREIRGVGTPSRSLKSRKAFPTIGSYSLIDRRSARWRAALN